MQELFQRMNNALERLGGYEPLPSMPFTLQQLLAVLSKHKGQFLHLNAGAPPILRIENELVPIGDRPLTGPECRNLVMSALAADQRTALFQGHELDFIHAEASSGFRFHVYMERGCPGLSVRKIRNDIPELMQLNLSGSSVEKFLNEHQGLLLLVGPPGCGKINTFASLIAHINAKRRARIITIEPRILFWHQNQESVIIQRELGSDTHSFAHAVRQVLHQDPDILAVGGIPDRDTAEVVIQAAAGGHLVVAVLDAASSVRAIDDLLMAFQNDGRIQQQLASVLKLVVCQHLVSRSDGRGKIPSFEILEASPSVAQAIARGQSNELFHHMRDEGQQTLARHLSRLVEVGMISYDEAIQHVDPEELEVGQPDEESVYTESSSHSSEPTDNSPLMSWL